MTPEKWIQMSFEAYALGSVLAGLPSDLPSIREARIQCGKLGRIVNDRNKHDTPFGAGIRALAGGPSKAWHKKEGKRAQLAGQQAEKVRELSDKVFKEFFRRGNPELTNAEYRQWRKHFELGMGESFQNFMQGVTQRVIEKMTTPPRRLPRRHK